jgi:hypothetical protein
VSGIYLDGDTQTPEWAAVVLAPGTIGIAPLAGADFSGRGIELPFPAQTVRDAPCQAPELLGELSVEDEATLDRHYGAAQHNGQGRDVASRTAAESRRVATRAAAEGQEVATRARERGQRVVQAAAAETGELADTAKDRAGKVARQASAEARGLLEETKARVEEQAAAGAERLGEGLGRLGQEVLALVEGRPQEAPSLGPVAQRAADTLLDAADRVHGVGADIESRGLIGLLEDVQAFARRRPGAFLLAAAAAGLVAGRAARATSGESDEREAQSASDRPPPTTASSRRQAPIRGGR